MADEAIPQGDDYTTDPMDVSEYASATLICRPDLLAASEGRRLDVVIEESDDLENWAAHSAGKAGSLPEESCELVRNLDFDRRWLRARFFPTPAGSRPFHFPIEIRLHKRKP